MWMLIRKKNDIGWFNFNNYLVLFKDAIEANEYGIKNQFFFYNY